MNIEDLREELSVVKIVRLQILRSLKVRHTATLRELFDVVTGLPILREQIQELQHQIDSLTTNGRENEHDHQSSVV